MIWLIFASANKVKASESVNNESSQLKLIRVTDNCSNEYNHKVQDGNIICDENTVKQEETKQLNKNTKVVYQGMKEMVKNEGNEDYCDICKKSFSKKYLKVHMINKHPTENVPLMNQMAKNSKTIDNEENRCPKCDANFRTVRSLRIHIEEVHEKKIETIEAPKAKRQKMPVILPPEPQ